ncbi:hypothetical protein ACF0H5_018636 [Mactra antiquata]
MDSLKLKKILTFMLLICLFIGLVIFCVIYIWSNQCKNDSAKMEANVTTEHLHQATEHPHHHHHHHDDTTVLTTTTVTTTDDDEDSLYKLSLKGGAEGNSGKVLIEYMGEQGFVCSNGFDNNDAQVVCKELGYRKGLSYNLIPVNPTSYSRYTNLQPFLTGLNCNGSESAIHECDGFHLSNETTVCTWFAAVLCYDDKPYELRLVGGVYPHSGMVEMKVGGVWGIFCAIKTHDDEVADILCRSMNYTGGFTSFRGMLGESPSPKVWVPYISCQEHVENLELLHSVFECDLVLNVENIAYDYIDNRGNADRNEYTACTNKPNSYAATVQCLK